MARWCSRHRDARYIDEEFPTFKTRQQELILLNELNFNAMNTHLLNHIYILNY